MIMSNNNQNNAAQMSPTMMSPMETMLQMMSGLWVSRGIYIAAKLGIADYLKDGTKTAEELAAVTDAHAIRFTEFCGCWQWSAFFIRTAKIGSV
jgi:hypothetical protein